MVSARLILHDVTQSRFQVGTAETTKDDEFEELLELFSKNELVVQKVAQVGSRWVPCA